MCSTPGDGGGGGAGDGDGDDDDSAVFQQCFSSVSAVFQPHVGSLLVSNFVLPDFLATHVNYGLPGHPSVPL